MTDVLAPRVAHVGFVLCLRSSVFLACPLFGLVPTLVDNGVVHIESNEIIESEADDILDFSEGNPFGTF